MGQNKYNKETQKLLDLIKAEGIEDRVEKDTDVEKFIQTFNITPGDDFIPILIIYYTYCKWRDRNRLGKRTFFNRFSKLFTNKVRSGFSGYLLDNSNELFDTSVENKFMARAFFRKSKAIRDRQKKKK